MGAGERVVVDDAVDRLVLVLQHHVVPDRAQVVAQVDDPGRLDAGEDARTAGRAPRGRRRRNELDGHRGGSVSEAGPGPTYPRATFATIAPTPSPAARSHRERSAPARRRHRRRHRRPRGRARLPRAVPPPRAARRRAARAGRGRGEVHGARDRRRASPRSCSRTRPRTWSRATRWTSSWRRWAAPSRPTRSWPPPWPPARAWSRRTSTSWPTTARSWSASRARRRDVPLRGGGRRRDPAARPDRPGPRGEPHLAGARHRQRDHQLHAHGDDPRGPRLRRGPRGGPGQGLRRGRSHRGRRGPRRAQQARDPRPARVRRTGSTPPPSATGPAPRPAPPGAPGITGVTAEDVAALAGEGRVLRLIATTRLAEDGAIEASVVPTAVPAESPFGRCDGVLNRVEVDATPVGRVAFEGPGAGGRRGRVGRPRRPRLDRARPRLDVGRLARRHGAVRRRGAARRRRSASRLRPAPATPSGTDDDDHARRPAPASSRGTASSCPVTDATPVVSLGEGATPLVAARRLGAAIGVPNLHLKIEGQNPTGSFKDRGMVAGRREGDRGGGPERHLRLDRQHVGIGRRLRRRRRPRVRRRAPGRQDRPGQAAPGAGLRRARDLRSAATSTRRCGSSGRSRSRTTTRSRSSTPSTRTGSRARRRPRSRSATTWAARRTSSRSRSATPATSAPTGAASASTATPAGCPRRRGCGASRPPAPRRSCSAIPIDDAGDDRHGDPHRQPGLVGPGDRRARRVRRPHLGRDRRRRSCTPTAS